MYTFVIGLIRIPRGFVLASDEDDGVEKDEMDLLAVLNN